MEVETVEVWGEEKVVCPTCGTKVESEHGLRIHFSRTHNEPLADLTVECYVCGSEKVVRPTHKENLDRFFCDKECESEYRRGLTGEDAPNWGGGSHRYYGRNWKRKRKERLEYDGFECRDCGLSNEEHLRRRGVSLHVHHKTPIREFDDPEEANTLDNLVSLCAICHRKREE